MQYVAAVVFLGLLTGTLAKLKGSSFTIWFLVGSALPFIGLLAVIFYRFERDELQRQCPRCARTVRLSDQLCTACGEDLFFPEDDEPVRFPSNGGVVVAAGSLEPAGRE